MRSATIHPSVYNNGLSGEEITADYVVLLAPYRYMEAAFFLNVVFVSLALLH